MWGKCQKLFLIYNLEDIVIFLAYKVFKFFPFLPVPFTIKVKIWISYKAYNWAFYALNINYTVPSGHGQMVKNYSLNFDP